MLSKKKLFSDITVGRTSTTHTHFQKRVLKIILKKKRTGVKIFKLTLN